MEWSVVFDAAYILLLCITVLWIYSVIVKDVTIVDTFWAVGFMIINFASLRSQRTYDLRRIIITFLLMIWGIRLAFYLTARHMGLPEDHRYAAIRRRVGKHFWLLSFVIVFLLQAILMLFISFPIINIQTSTVVVKTTILDIIGSVLCVTGIYFEAVSDHELSVFKSNPQNKGKVLKTGLWSVTRHPNYFGDACFWWGIFVINMSVPSGYYMVMSPIVMTYLLLRVSGVTLLERSLKRSKEGYEQYVRTTPEFIPKLF